MAKNVDPNGYELPPSPYRSSRRLGGKDVEKGMIEAGQVDRKRLADKGT
jgi:hypothetical protein